MTNATSAPTAPPSASSSESKTTASEEQRAAEEAEREAKLQELLSAFKDKEAAEKEAKEKAKEKETESGEDEEKAAKVRGSRVSPLTLAEMQSVGTMCRVYFQQSVLSDAPIMMALVGLHRVRAVGAVEGTRPLRVKVEHHREPPFIHGDPLKAHAREILDLLRTMHVNQLFSADFFSALFMVFHSL